MHAPIYIYIYIHIYIYIYIYIYVIHRCGSVEGQDGERGGDLRRKVHLVIEFGDAHAATDVPDCEHLTQQVVDEDRDALVHTAESTRARQSDM
jgi:hypothetical protein